MRILALRERAAEKVRAFIDRQLGRDAFDLWYYAAFRLKRSDWVELPNLIAAKLQRSDRLKAGDAVPAAFDNAVAQIQKEWDPAQDFILVEDPPDLPAVIDQVKRFRETLPEIVPAVRS
jgi:predicted nucleotidyltransferase component of viral defense system